MTFLLGEVTKADLDSLKDNMQIFQNNINNNISWFYAALAIIVGILLVSLVFLVTESIKKGISKGIDDIESTVRKEIEIYRKENERFKNDIDERILRIVSENYPLRWAQGAISANYLEDGKYLKVTNLDGPIHWDYPTTVLEIKARDDFKPLAYVIVEQGSNGFTAEMLGYSSILHGNTIEWSVIWERVLK